MRPNIVFITTDTQGRDMVSAYTKRYGVSTPHIDKLAEEGVLFENAFTSAPVCTPARSTWYTGLYPNRSGAIANELSCGRGVPMLAEILTAHQYQAYHIGKWHLDAGGYNGRGQADGGFDQNEWYDLHSFFDEVGREGPNKFGGWNRGLYDGEYCFAHRVADRAIDLIRRKGKQSSPYFLSVSFDEPHGPYICPPPFQGMFEQERLEIPPSFRAEMENKPEIQRNYADFHVREGNGGNYPSYYHRYYDCNSYVDDEIGRVLDALANDGAKNTIVIYTSDHGDHLGAFGLTAKGPTMYDRTIAVPLIVAAPGLSPGGRRETGIVSFVDVWSTILDLAGVSLEPFTASRGYAGRSLLPVLRGECSHVRDEVIVEFDRFGLLHDQDDGFFPIRCIRSRDWKLAVNLFDKDELYHISEDPEEMENLIDRFESVSIRNTLHDRLLEWQRETKDLLRGPVWGRRPWRTDFEHRFEGLFTTGFKEKWEYGPF